MRVAAWLVILGFLPLVTACPCAQRKAPPLTDERPGVVSAWTLVPGWPAPIHATPDGKLLLYTGAADGSPLKLLSYGAPDPDFRADVGIKGSLLDNLADGRLVGLSPETPGASAYFLTRYQANGGIDPAYGASGHARLDFGAGAKASVIRPLSDGSVLAAGCVENAATAITIWKVGPSGNVDTAFATGGKLVITDTSRQGGCVASIFPAGGQLLFYVKDSTGVVFYRASAAGGLDTAFDGANAFWLKNGTSPLPGRGLAIEWPGGLYLVAGAAPGETAGSYVARYLASGAIDPSFAGGNVALSLPRPEFPLLGDDGSLYIAGAGGDGTGYVSLVIAKLKSDGSLDPAFGTHGISTVPIERLVEVLAITRLPDGTIVAAGEREGAKAPAQTCGDEAASPSTENILVELHADGTP